MEENPTKERLFEYLSENEEHIKHLLSQQKFSEIIDKTVSDCYDEVIKGDKYENIGIFVTGLLHYLLTNALLASQRKLEHRGIDLDIVIPDLKTLEKDPKKSLIIYVARTNNRNTIEQKIKNLQEIQPEKQNIWVVVADNINVGNKSYVVDKANNTFSEIIFDIAQFVNVQGKNKFKILKV